MLSLLWPEIHRRKISYKITESQLIRREGIIRFKNKRFGLDSITDAEIKQNIWERIMNFGSIEVISISSNILPIVDVDNPQKFVEILERRIKENNIKK